MGSHPIPEAEKGGPNLMGRLKGGLAPGTRNGCAAPPTPAVAVGGGRWAVGGGRWAVGGGRWAVGGGRWAVGG
jgi:hypothetical protein